jgi:hypothetical protein
MHAGVNMIPLQLFKVKNFCLFSNPVPGFSHVSGKEIGINAKSKTNFKGSFVAQAFLVRSFKNRIVKYLSARRLSTTIEIAEPGGSLDAENVYGLSGKFCGGASDLDRWAGCRRPIVQDAERSFKQCPGRSHARPIKRMESDALTRAPHPGRSSAQSIFNEGLKRAF